MRTAESKVKFEDGLKSIKSVLLIVLMISMSLSAGIIEVSRGPWLIEEVPSELEPPIPEPMYSAPADWELIPSESNIEVTESSAISDLTFNWTAWSSGVVNGTSTVHTQGDSGHYNDIAIDSNGKAHIVFYRVDNTNIYHSTNATASGNWETNDVDTSGNVGQFCSIAIDSNDGLHVSYQYNTGNTLKYAYKASGSSWSSSWSKATVDNTGGKYTSIAIDSNDKPHIVYRDGGSYGGDIAYAEKTSGSWSVDSPLQSAGDAVLTSIAIDSDDHIHIAYYDSNNEDMDYLTNTSGSWSNSFLEDIGPDTGGMDLDIAIDPTTDQPGISFFDKDATALKYIYYTGSSWPSAIVENSNDYGRFNSIAYDSLGNVHISHERNSADDLYYTSDKTGSWVSTAIDTSAAGLYTAIAVDSNDDVHIAYRYNTGKDLYVATVQGHNAGSVTRTDVTGATCSISPSIPNGLTLNQGTCTISGTPTVAGSNITYNLTATASTGLSKTGEFNLWVTPPAPNSLVYSPENMTLTKGTLMSTNTPSVGGGTVTGWEISPSIPNGMAFSGSTGAISGTPSVLQLTAVVYTVWANNSAGSTSASINITINDASPSVCYGPLVGCSGTHVVALAQNVTINTLVPNYLTGTGMPTSCSTSPSLPAGLFISSNCEITGTPTVLSSFAFYSVTASNSGGSGTNSNALYLGVVAAGGTLTVTPTNTEGSVNSSISDITMSYSHVASNYGWTSGVSNTSTDLLSSFHEAEEWLSIDSGESGEMAIVYARNDTGASTHSLGLLYRWGGSWTETIIDNGTDTGHYPSVVIDRNGALHISYIDDDNDVLRYATNVSGSWVLTTLGNSTYDNDDGRGTAIVVHPITDAVHIVTTINDNTYRDLQYHTNEDGSWENTTITNTLWDEGHDPSMAMDGDGNLHVAYYCDNGCSDLRLSSRIDGVWQNETVDSTGNTGNSPDIAIDSQGTIHIVHQYLNDKKIYLHSGTPGSWTAQTGLTGGHSWWPTVAVDSNDAVHISYHLGGILKDVKYMTNASGSWPTPSTINGYGGWGSEMTIDENDDIFVPNIIPNTDKLQLTTVEGSGEGLAVRPIYDITPMLPDGLTMNWRNGTISGTPTEVHANTTHLVTVTVLGTTTTATFTLYVSGAPGDISYSDISGTKDTTIASVTPFITSTGTSGSITSWAINASLPSGLTFETSNGTIWGTPSVAVTGAVFTVWANNSVGSKSTTVNITISDLGVAAITYPSENITLTLYHTITTATPSTTGGTATSWGISPDLPAGLSFNAGTGAISGTPENLQTTAVTYTVWANNSGGDFSDQINITINDYGPVPLNYFGDDITLNYNQTLTPIDDFELKPDVMAAGEEHTCAIKDDGTVRCWGEGSYGRLGIGNSNDKSSPVATNTLGSGRTAIDITAGGEHTCAVLDDGSIVCWGRNNNGQLGDNTTSQRTSPTQTVPLPRPAVAVEAGFDFTCALMDNGSVMCWGSGSSGRLGNGGGGVLVPTFTNPIPGGRKAVAIDISHYHACAVLEDGYVACWGPGNNNRLGTGSTSAQSSPTLINYFNETNRAVDVALGRYTGCGLLDDGTVTCWGSGYLGNGGSVNKNSPGLLFAALGTGRTAVEIEMGRFHACAILDNGNVKCWGDDQYGQMANGNSHSDQNNPSLVSFASGIEAESIHVGHWHTCITAQTNEIYCWGDGDKGKLGDGASSQNNWAGSGAKVNHFSGSQPVLNYGDITSWAIHPALPTGLALGSTNGTLYGTPTASTLASTTYTIYANNSGGSSTTTIRIMVNDEAPDISYSPDWFVLTYNTAMSPTATPTNTGGAIPSGILDSTGDVGRYTSIAIDSNGYRHISYYDDTNGDLKYATDKSGSWVTTSVDTTNNVGYYTSIAVDSNGAVHISYFDGNNIDLKYATDKSGSWVITTVDSTDFVGWYTSIAVDSNDAIHISYFDKTNDDLKYATDKSGSWVTTSVDTTDDVGEYSSIAVDSNDDVHISYYDYTNGDLKYATDKSGSWVVSSAHSTWTTSGMYSSIAVDSGGDIHISHHDFTYDSLLYSTYDGSSWTTSTVDTGSVGAYSSIALDSSSNPRIAYHANSGFNLKFASYFGSYWTTSIIASAGDVGTHTSMAVDSNDAIHISYFDDSTDDLGYITLDSSSNVYGYSISPALPAGLSLNIGTGEISGTPTALSTNTTYTITARNSGGVNTTTITIKVIDTVPTLSLIHI